MINVYFFSIILCIYTAIPEAQLASSRSCMHNSEPLGGSPVLAIPQHQSSSPTAQRLSCPVGIICDAHIGYLDDVVQGSI